MGNSEILSSSSSSQGVILELEGEQAEDTESNDLGEYGLSLEDLISVSYCSWSHRMGQQNIHHCEMPHPLFQH